MSASGLPSLHVRLPNHLGDACMCVPALDLLATRFALTLAGKPWLGPLFEAYAWPVVPLSGSWWGQRTALRNSAARRAEGVSALLFTNSIGSALQLRLAGLRPRGYATEARNVLLERAIPVPERWSGDMHTVEYYLHLACCAFDLPDAPLPDALRLRVSEPARARVQAVLAGARVAQPYVVVCPVAVGLHHGKLKAWDGFGKLCHALRSRGATVVAMPGPGEADAVRAAAADATVLPASDVGTFAALLAGSRLVIANDSGPGHLAAAVGAPVVSIFGVTDPRKTRPWGPTVTVIGSGRQWPSYKEVEALVLARLARPAGPTPSG